MQLNPTRLLSRQEEAAVLPELHGGDVVFEAGERVLRVENAVFGGLVGLLKLEYIYAHGDGAC